MFKKTFFITAVIMFLAVASHISATNVNLQTKTPAPAQDTTKEVILDKNNDSAKVVSINNVNSTDYKEVSTSKLVMQPEKYLNKNIKFKAKFDKFSAIGLDYAPTNRDSKKHVSFLVKKENVTNYNIPLSELKLILKRDYAEKELVNLESGNEIEVFGNVFSNALGDPWVDVEKVTILTPKTTNNQTENTDASNNENKGK